MNTRFSFLTMSALISRTFALSILNRSASDCGPFGLRDCSVGVGGMFVSDMVSPSRFATEGSPLLLLTAAEIEKGILLRKNKGAFSLSLHFTSLLLYFSSSSSSSGVFTLLTIVGEITS